MTLLPVKYFARTITSNVDVSSCVEFANVAGLKNNIVNDDSCSCSCTFWL